MEKILIFRQQDAPATQKKLRLRPSGISLAIFLLGVTFLTYIPTSESIDGSALLATASSVARRGSLDINVIAHSDWLLPPISGMGILGNDGNVYSKKGLTPSLLMAPLVMVADALPALTPQATAMLFNPVVTILTAILLYILAQNIGLKANAAWLTALMYGCATMALVYAGTLFGEPLAALLLTLVVLAYARWRTARGKRALLLAGVMGTSFGLLIGVNLVYAALIPLAAMFLGSHTLIRRPDDDDPTEKGTFTQRAWTGIQTGVIFALPIAFALIGIGALNAARFGDPFTSGYRFAEGEGFIHPLWSGLFGLVFSPYRGVFWYNPLLWAALPGVWFLLRQRSTRAVMLLALALAAGVALLFASWWSWHGGIVWGPRFLIPALPLLMLPLAPVIERLGDPAGRARARRPLRLVLIGGFAGLVLLSIGIQVIGALISYVPYYAELKAAHFTGDMTAIVTELDDTVLTDPALSPILGQARLLGAGTPPQVAWLAQGVDGGILLAALSLLALGVAIAYLPPSRSWRWGILLIALGAAGIVAWRGGAPTQPRIDRLATAVEGADSVVVASTAYGAALIDLETRARVVSINAPVSETDNRAQQLWAHARLGSAHFAYLTWIPPADPLDWMGRALFESAAFLGEQPLDGHRLLRFETSAPPLAHDGGWLFGEIRLNRWGAQLRQGFLDVAVEWQITSPINTSWFIHVVDADGRILAQQDRAPMGGYALNSSGQQGGILQDRLAFALDPLPSGASLRIGWIDPVTGERLPVTAADGTAVSDGFIVLPLESLAPNPP